LIPRPQDEVEVLDADEPVTVEVAGERDAQADDHAVDPASGPRVDADGGEVEFSVGVLPDADDAFGQRQQRAGLRAKPPDELVPEGVDAHLELLAGRRVAVEQPCRRQALAEVGEDVKAGEFGDVLPAVDEAADDGDALVVVVLEDGVDPAGRLRAECPLA